MSDAQATSPPSTPRPPRNVHIRPSSDQNARSTGLELSSYRSSLRNRGREYPEDKILPIEATDKLFDYFRREAEKHDGSRCVFLLWGSEDSEKSTTCAIDVRISDTDAEETIMRELKEAYYDKGGSWRKYFALRDVTQVKPVKFRFIQKCSKRFIVSMEPLDTNEILEVYSRKLEDTTGIANSIIGLDSEAFPNCCLADKSGEYIHENISCPVNSPDNFDPVCPFEEYDRCVNVINWTKTIAFFTHYFKDPTAAEGQIILQGFPTRNFIHYYGDIRTHYGFHPQRRYEEWTGLYLKEAWKIERCVYVFGTLVVLVLLTGKLIWGTWEITFAAGAFFIALPMLGLAMLSFCI